MTGTGAPPERMSRARIFDEARTVHLERIPEVTPALFIFRQKRYDFDESIAKDVGAVQKARTPTVWFLLRSALTRVELNEPALIKAWPSLAGYVLAIRIRNIFTLPRRRIRIVMYAIDNSDIAGNLSSYFHLPRRVGVILTRLAFRFLVPRHSRIAFGTHQARESYLRVVPNLASRVECELVPALPTTCRSCNQPGTKSRLLTFLGAFEERKGILTNEGLAKGSGSPAGRESSDSWQREAGASGSRVGSGPSGSQRIARS